jgi:hypothetical protein
VLHKLKNGDWIRLSNVTGIMACPESKLVRPYVVIDAAGASHIVNFETHAEAAAYRDELAGLVNEWAKRLILR